MGSPDRVDALSPEANHGPVYDDEIYDHFVYTDKSRIPYSHIEPLGHGTFGFVDKVKRTDGPFGGRIYARKTIQMPLDIGTSMKAIPDRLNNEVRIIKMARHTHIVSVTATYMCGRDFAIIMTPVADRNLEEFLHGLDTAPWDGGRRLRARIGPWFGCLISGLAYLHANGIRHRDVKPSNILITARSIYFTDFGLAMERPGDTTLTLTDTLGTKLYRAPEISDWTRSGRPADVFSLGAVFLEMLSVDAGPGWLSTFKQRRQSYDDRSYAGNLDKVSSWIVQLSRTVKDPFWGHSTMLVFCSQMLKFERDARPHAEALRLCWSQRPFLELPTPFCGCILHPQSPVHRADRSGDQPPAHSSGHCQNLLFRVMEGVETLIDWPEAVHRPRIGELLHQAARKGHLSLARRLLDDGANIEEKDTYGRVPLHWAALFGHEATIKLLLERHADINATQGHGWTPLFFATWAGRETAVRTLLESGADPNAEDKSGQTALHSAHSERVTQLLVDGGANIHKQAKNGWTPLQLAEIHQRKDVVRLLKEKSVESPREIPKQLTFPSRPELRRNTMGPGNETSWKKARDWLRNGKPMIEVSLPGNSRISYSLNNINDVPKSPLPLLTNGYGKNGPLPLVKYKEREVPLKGILKRSTARFPEDPNPIREGVARARDAGKKGVPPGATWTKISRRIVDPAALEENRERFEATPDHVIVLRVLNTEEVQNFIDRTQEIREGRYEAEPRHRRRDEHDDSSSSDEERIRHERQKDPLYFHWRTAGGDYIRA